MRFLNFFIAGLLTITFSLNINAATSIDILSINNIETKRVDGGPRTVIQAMTDVTILQTTMTNLHITIEDSEGELVVDETTCTQDAVFCTENWAEGTYKIVTIDDNEEYQEFFITVE